MSDQSTTSQHELKSLTQADKKSALHLLFYSAREEKSHLMAGTILLLIASLLEASGPILGKHFIDTYVIPKNLQWTIMIVLVLGTLISGCISTGLRYFQLVRLAGVATRSVQRLRMRVYSHVLRLPMSYFDTAITGQLVSRVTNDSQAVEGLYIQVLFVILDSAIVVLGALVAMAWLDWKMMLIVALLIPSVLIIVAIYQKLSAPAVAKARQMRSEINAQVAESIFGMSSLQAYNAHHHFLKRFHHTNHQHFLSRMREVRANAFLLRPALVLLNTALLISVIYMFGKREFTALEVGVLYAFVSYIDRVVDPLIQITLQFSQIQQAIIAATRVDHLLREKQEAHFTQHTHSSESLKDGSIRIEDLYFSYHHQAIDQTRDKPTQSSESSLSPHWVLKHVNMEIPSGALIGIVGYTGSGKSTLLSLLLRLYPIHRGLVQMGGVKLQALSDAHFRAQVGLVAQEPFLMAASAKENIRMGRNMSDEAIMNAAKLAQAHEFISALEQAYDTPLGEGGTKLSTGQKQLIAIARALAGQPKILFLDEATSHIDSETEQLVQRALHALKGKVTVVAIAHRLSTIREADTIFVLNHGHIVEQGAHQDLMRLENGLYQKLYWMQSWESQEESQEES